MPHESLDARDDLPKQLPSQVALGQLQDEVPSVPNEPAAGLEESLLRENGIVAVSGHGAHYPFTASRTP